MEPAARRIVISAILLSLLIFPGLTFASGISGTTSAVSATAGAHINPTATHNGTTKVGVGRFRARLNSTPYTQVMSGAFAYVSCRTNFTVGFANSTISSVPNLSSSLNPMIERLQQETSQLQGYYNQTNFSAFASYVKSSYDPQLSGITSGIKQGIKAAKLTKNQTAQLRSEYNSEMSNYSSCEFTALKSYDNGRMEIYSNIIASYQQDIIKLDSRGVNTSALSELVQNSDEQIVVPLQIAISQATTPAQLSAAVNQYCLFNACSNGTDYHLAANYQADRLGAIIQKMQTYPNYTSSQYLASAESSLGSATALLGQVGSKPYSSDMDKKIWGDLNQTTANLKSLVGTK